MESEAKVKRVEQILINATLRITAMHESIAAAMLKGELRRFKDDFTRKFDNFILPNVRSRNLWTKTIIQYICGYEGSAIISHVKLPTLSQLESLLKPGKSLNNVTTPKNDHAIYFFHPIEVTIDSKILPQGWLGFRALIHPRNFEYIIFDVPLRISFHVVQRIMQRKNLFNPIDAIMMLQEPLMALPSLLDGPKGEIILEAKGGLVFVNPDEYNSELWTICSFIDDEQVKPGQREIAQHYKQLSQRKFGLNLTTTTG